MTRMTRWLEEVKRDTETPDLWAAFNATVNCSVTFPTGPSKTPDSPRWSKTNIAMRLQEWAEYTRRTHSLSAEQIRSLDATITYLIDALGRFGRKDWILLFIGVAATFALASAFPPESVREFLQAVIQAIGHGLFGGPAI